MKATLTIEVEFDADVTDAESLATAADRLLETALSTPNILDDYANPRFGEFFVAAGPDSLEAERRWVLYDSDTDTMLSTRAYRDYNDAVADAAQVNDVLVLPLTIHSVTV